MSKYSEAVSNIRMLVGCNELHFDDIKVLQEACGKAEKYDELNNTIPMWVDKVEEEAPRNPVDRVKRLIKENEQLIKDALGFKQDVDEANKTIDTLKAERDTLVDFIKDMEIKFSSYGFFFIANRVPNEKAFEILDIVRPNDEYTKQLKKAMFEIVEGK